MKYLCLFIVIFSYSNCYSYNKCLSSNPERQTLKHNGIEREFFVYLPNSYNPKKSNPLVLNFHGYGGSAYMFMFNTGFNDMADKEGFIVVHPQGTLLNGRSHWNIGGSTEGSKVDDYGFIGILIEFLERKYNIDSNRIYASGMSNGGYFAFGLACQMSDKIAAIASVTGSMTPRDSKKCQINRPVGILQLHGTNDNAVPYNGKQGRSMAIQDVIEFWKSKNGIETKVKMRAIRDLDKKDGSTVEKYTYSGGENNTDIVHYKVVGGGHNWFGNRGNKDIKATEIIWDYFSKYTLDGKEN
jgi:polyhydroxybutyrate depolymerase